MDRYRTLKQEAWKANQDLGRHGLVFGTFGNASAADRTRGFFAIKPSGMPLDEIRPGDLVVMDFEGRVVEGKRKPSSDTPTHAVLYSRFEGVGGICHTHSPYATAWAQARRAIPILGTTHADHLPHPVPCTAVLDDRRIKGDYERETGLLIIETFKHFRPSDVPMVLVACHGPFTWGPTVARAVHHSVVLEELARMALATLQINSQVPQVKRSLIERHFFRKHGPDATYGQKTA